MDYINRFTTVVHNLEEAEEPTIMIALLNGLRGTRFIVELIDHKVKTFSEDIRWAQGTMNIEEYLTPKFKQALQWQKGKARGQNLRQRRRRVRPPTGYYLHPGLPNLRTRERHRIRNPES